MKLHEYVGVIHFHTVHSDGTATLDQIIDVANQTGLDFVIPTDHNVYLKGRDGWYGRTLMLIGEEIHDIERDPEASHYLVFDTQRELKQYAPHPQQLIDAVNAAGGFGFLAHPFERTTNFVMEPDISWVDWQVEGYTGLELWNYMSEFKGHLPNLARTILYAYLPKLAMSGPYPETVQKWDELLREGHKVAIMGGPDAHGVTYSLGPLRRAIFPYDYLFRACRTHILTEQPFKHDLAHDRELLYNALRGGYCFVAYDLLADSTGFRFTAQSGEHRASMGQEVRLHGEVCFEVVSPVKAHLRLLRNGEVIVSGKGRRLTASSQKTGAYRVEAYRTCYLKKRGWVYTNPIYVSTLRSRGEELAPSHEREPPLAEPEAT